MPSVAELLAALPEERVDVEPDTIPDSLRQLHERLAKKRVPLSMLRRSWKLGGLHARIGLAYLSYWVKSWYMSNDRRQQLLVDAHLQTAFKLLETMGYLRGAVMKIGQILASFPDILPDQFVDTLKHLHFQAPPMHYSLIREQLINEFGDDPEVLFDHFETEAFAAASLGQVHRARLKSGEEVAIKIQYPGIARTIRSDFRTLLAIMTPLRLTRDWENVKDQVQTVREILELETDYENEAESLRQARLLFGEDEGIIVPRVFEQFSTRRVLTMDYIAGRVTSEFLSTNPSQELRNQFAERIYRAGTRLFARRRMYYSDVHPGNYIFCDDGQLGLIDFGGVRVLNDQEWEYMRLANEAMRGSREDLLGHIQRGLLLNDDEMHEKTELIDLMVEFCEYYWRPFKSGGEFDYSDPAFLREGFDLMARVARLRHSRQQPVNLLAHRASFEMSALFYQLQACVPAKSLWDEESKAAGYS